MAGYFDKGIVMTGPFAVAAAYPADIKFIAENIQERDSHVTEHRAYEGMIVYVKSEQQTYQLKKGNIWEEFGSNSDAIQANVENSLTSTSTVKALSAAMGKQLNDNFVSHSEDNTIHINESDRTNWNNKAPNTIASDIENGLMSKEDKKKLDSIDSGANTYVHPPTHPATMIVEDASHRFVTDTEKSTWNNKAPNTIVSTGANGLMSTSDKEKLDNIEVNANNYQHPTTHSATMIVEDTSHRFVTDTEKANWNAKPGTNVVSQTANGLMSAVDKKKLDGIAEGANKYIHPNDANTRHVTDEEKTKWNSKADAHTHPYLPLSGGTLTGPVVFNNYLKLNALQNHGTGIISLWYDANSTKMNIDTATSLAVNKKDVILEGDTRLTNPRAASDVYAWAKASTKPVYTASEISTDTTHRFVTDNQIESWNSKPGSAELVLATPTSNGLMSKEDKKKIDGIAEGANKYIHPASHPATMIAEDATHKFVTEAQINTWNSKPSTSIATQSVNGLMSKEDKKKLDGIAEGANKYIHPNDANTRHVTDTQINTWNAKASTSVCTQTANGLMSAVDKKKLDGIASGANNYVHPASHPATMITEDADHKFVSGAQKDSILEILDTMNITSAEGDTELSFTDRVPSLKSGIIIGTIDTTGRPHTPTTFKTVGDGSNTILKITTNDIVLENPKDKSTVNLLDSINKLKAENTKLRQNLNTVIEKLKTAVFIG